MTILGRRNETSHTSSMFGHKIRSLRRLNPDPLKEHGRRPEKIADQSEYWIDRSWYPAMEDIRIKFEQEIPSIVEAVGKRVPLWMRFVRVLSISQYGEDLKLRGRSLF